MRSQQAYELERDASVIARDSARAIEARIEEQDLGPLGSWARAALTANDPEQWHDKAELFLADHPAFSAIARVEGGRIVDVAASRDGREVLRSLDAGQLARSEAADPVGAGSVGPIRLADGRAVLLIQIAAPRLGEGAPKALAVLDPEIALSRVLEGRATGYAIRVLWGGEDVYRTSKVDPDGAEDRSWAVESVRFGIGPDGSVSVRANELAAGDLRRKAPWFALITGLLISALIASLVHVSQLSRIRAEELARANVDLRGRINAAARDQVEIHRLNEVLEARVAERTSELHETIAELETFNYSVSHDLRSPLGAILAFSAIISQDYGQSLDEPVRDYLKRISSSARDILSQMDGLLAFSRSGREEIRKTRVDVQKLVQALCDDLPEARGANAGTFLIGDLPSAYADASVLRLVFSNLISNACKFVRDGDPPHVEIGGRVDDRDVVYFVRDEGIGFDMRFAERLFGVFERLHASDEYEGHGVGLAIVARLMARHGGGAWAEGALGKGATFYIRLPVQGEADGSRRVLHV